jgi:F-type H+-transporting ATPase subunit a
MHNLFNFNNLNLSQNTLLFSEQEELYINSPLEQFEVVNLISLNAPIFGHMNIALTNLALYTLIVLTILISFHILGNNDVKLIPSKWSIALESSYSSILSMVREQIGAHNEEFFPLVYSVFFFIIIANLTGNVPYNFTVGTSLIVSLGLSITIFISVTVLALTKHKLAFFSFFVPSGTPLALTPILTLVELVSYFARAFSLGVRLLANLAAGHTLLKILSTFLAKLFTSSILIAILTLIPFAIFVAIIGLEIAVSIIQAYVFSLLFCSYIKDAIELH